MPPTIMKPTSPGVRGATRRDFSTLSKVKPTKSLLKTISKSGGRNNSGRITVRHIGGGHKQLYRMIDFRRPEVAGEIASIEYDPNRSAHIALVAYENTTHGYIIATKGMKVGDKVEAAEQAKIQSGNTMKMVNIPTGVAIHNIEITPGKGAAFVRSAGLSATIMAQEESQVVIKLPSGELRRFNNQCVATVGEVSNESHENTVYGKAGRKRWMGIRPTVRGKAMNPNSHPHGGGEGNTSIGMKYPKTPWGAPALGARTRNKKNRSAKMIIRRRNK